MIDSFDAKRRLDSYRATTGEWRLVDVPDLQYLMLDGHGDPNTSRQYADTLETLYPVAYAMKFASKRGLGRDFVVPPLEGLWWAEDMAAFTSARDKSRWSWTLMILVPEWLGEQEVSMAVRTVADKGPRPRLDDVRLETLSEGRCVQRLHVGSYDDEAAVLADLHDVWIPGQGLTMTGKHHEVYLSDPRRTAPAKLRTILRQPVR